MILTNRNFFDFFIYFFMVSQNGPYGLLGINKIWAGWIKHRGPQWENLLICIYKSFFKRTKSLDYVD